MHRVLLGTTLFLISVLSLTSCTVTAEQSAAEISSSSTGTDMTGSTEVAYTTDELKIWVDALSKQWIEKAMQSEDRTRSSSDEVILDHRRFVQSITASTFGTLSIRLVQFEAKGGPEPYLAYLGESAFKVLREIDPDVRRVVIESNDGKFKYVADEY